MNEKGRNAGSHRPVSIPPTAPTEVAPALLMKSAPRARRTASTTISNLSIGGGTKTLVTNIIEPKSAAMNSRTIFCIDATFLIEDVQRLKNLDVTGRGWDSCKESAGFSFFLFGNL